MAPDLWTSPARIATLHTPQPPFRQPAGMHLRPMRAIPCKIVSLLPHW
jgi:hypothetical protein